MKALIFFLTVAITILSTRAVSDTTDRRASLSAAATAFYTALRAERIEGVPTDEALESLSPLLTPGLKAVLVSARAYQKRQIEQEPDEKPDWIEGDLFGSLFEGAGSWKLGDAFDAPGVDATVKVNLRYEETQQKPVTWTDTLVFKDEGGQWLLDDIRMGGKWAFRSGDSLRGRLPGGLRESGDHVSLDGRWQVAFQRSDDEVTGITIAAKEPASEAQTLFGGDEGASCPFPTWMVWNPDCDLLAIRLGESPRFTRTLIYRLVGETWKEVPLPEFFPEERKILAENRFRERDRLIDAEHWQDAKTLVVLYFGNFTNGDDGDGFSKFISVAIDGDGTVKMVGAVDTPGEP